MAEAQNAAVTQAAALVEEAAELSSNFAVQLCAEERSSRVAKLHAAALELLTSVDCEGSTAPAAERGRALCLRGRVLGAGPVESSAEAEDCLTRAVCAAAAARRLGSKHLLQRALQLTQRKQVKLCPETVEAWNALGLVFWRRGRLLDARAAFVAANAHSVNAASLRHLSGVTRALAQACKSATDRLTLSAESVAHAKAALALGLADGSSWYCLAMAHLAHAFVAGGGAADAMAPVLKAFAQAERCGEAARNPDLHFNRGVALRYLEDFQGAADSFTAAGGLDDTLPWRQQLDSLLEDVGHVHDLVQARGRQKPKRVAAAAAAAAATAPPSGFVPATLSALVAGANSDKALACRLLATASAQGAVPVVHVAVDAVGDCFALSLFGLREGAAREGMSVVIVAPHLAMAQLRAGERSLGYPLVRVHGAAGLLSGGAHPNAHAEPPMLSASRSS